MLEVIREKLVFSTSQALNSLVENTPKIHLQKYQNEDEPVPMLVLIPVHLSTGTFGVDGTYG